jgi:K(+)-stimulated pyrophosphate-energized sodium pump
MSETVLVLALVAGVAALVLAIVYTRAVTAFSPGNARMIELSTAIREGAMAFIRREYTWIAVFVVAMAVLITVMLEDGPLRAVAYVFGALLSGGAGFVGMRIATAANARTAEAAREGGAQKALPLAFRGGAVMGFTVAGLGLLGVALGYLLFVSSGNFELDNGAEIITAMGLGGSSIALFARVGGGIYTKAADVGADLVGKVEAGIPEDDPRNPAVIADNVGDNVGDVAGMGADLFESYVGALVAPIAFAAFAFSARPEVQSAAIVFPLAVAAVGMFASIIGSFLVKPKDQARLASALHRGTNTAMVLAALGVLGLAYWVFGDAAEQPLGLWVAVVVGLAVGWLIGKLSEIYTSDHYGTVKNISKQAETGPATVVLAGIAAGKLSAAYSVLVTVAGVFGAYAAGNWALGEGGGVYGVAIAAIGVLATLGITISVDAYGPIADNAGGIAEMAHLPKEVRETTDALDSLGNTTAAIAKGFAIGSAAVTALALFTTFVQAVGVAAVSEGVENPLAGGINVADVSATIGLFLGAAFPFLFSALTISAVGRAAFTMIEEVRRQFREIPGLKEGREGTRAEYAKCVDIATAGALREMVVPGALAIILPLVIGFINVVALGAFLAGALVTGFLLAIYMANSGGAWDNAKKYIEGGAHGGKGSEAHKAAVTGDTVGDPYKDTAGPAINPMLKLVNIVALLIIPFLG